MYEEASQSIEAAQHAARASFFQKLVFAAMALGISLPSFFGPTPGMLLARQIVYVGWVLIVLTTMAAGFRRLTNWEFLVLVSAFLMAAFMFLTTVVMAEKFSMDFLGGLSFFFGVVVYTILLPRHYAEKCESVVLFTTVVGAMSFFVVRCVQAEGTIPRDNTMSVFAAGTALFLLLRTFRRFEPPIKRGLSFASFLFMVFVMIRGMGRTAIGGFCATLICFLWFRSRYGGKLLLSFLVIILIGGLLWTDMGASFVSQFLFKQENRTVEDVRSLTGRTDVWQKAFAAAGSILWVGNGRDWIFEITGLAAHSSYLEVYFAYGIFAAAAWMGLCLVAFYAAVRALRARRIPGRPPLAPLFVFFFLITSLTESLFSSLFDYINVVFYMCVGLCFYEIRAAGQAAETAELQAVAEEEAPAPGVALEYGTTE